MGGLNSKSSQGETIHSKVIRLLAKLDTETTIDSRVKENVIEALTFYTTQVQRAPITYDLIQDAFIKLTNLKTANYKINSQNINFQKAKEHILHINKRLKFKNIIAEEYENMLLDITAYYQVLLTNINLLKKNDRQQISVIFLEIYSRCPAKKTTTKNSSKAGTRKPKQIDHVASKTVQPQKNLQPSNVQPRTRKTDVDTPKPKLFDHIGSEIVQAQINNTQPNSRKTEADSQKIVQDAATALRIDQTTDKPDYLSTSTDFLNKCIEDFKKFIHEQVDYRKQRQGIEKFKLYLHELNDWYEKFEEITGEPILSKKIQGQKEINPPRNEYNRAMMFNLQENYSFSDAMDDSNQFVKYYDKDSIGKNIDQSSSKNYNYPQGIVSQTASKLSKDSENRAFPVKSSVSKYQETNYQQESQREKASTSDIYSRRTENQTVSKLGTNFENKVFPSHVPESRNEKVLGEFKNRQSKGVSTNYVYPHGTVNQIVDKLNPSAENRHFWSNQEMENYFGKFENKQKAEAFLSNHYPHGAVKQSVNKFAENEDTHYFGKSGNMQAEKFAHRETSANYVFPQGIVNQTVSKLTQNNVLSVEGFHQQNIVKDEKVVTKFENKKAKYDTAKDVNFQRITPNDSPARYLQQPTIDTDHLKTLSEFENKLQSIYQSNNQFGVKKVHLEELATKLRSIPIHGEASGQKIKLLNRIDGLLMLEVANYLKEIRQTLKNCEINGDQKDWNSRKIQLNSIRNHLQQVVSQNPYIQRELNLISQKLNSLSNEFDKKTQAQKKVIDRLEKIASEILRRKDKINLSLKEILQLCNKYRKDINLVVTDDSTIVQKKKEVALLLHTYEERALLQCDQKLQIFKKTLNRYEKDLQELSSYPINDDFYQQKNNQIILLWQNYYTDISEELLPVLLQNVELVLELLGNVQTYSNEIVRQNEVLDIAERNVSRVTTERFSQLLIPHEETVEQAKLNPIDDNTLKKAYNIENKIAVKKAKTELKKLYFNLKELGQSSDVAKAKIDQIFCIKLRFDSLPDGPGLDRQKLAFLEDFYKVVHDIDEFLAEVLHDKKQTPTILDLADQFTFKPEALELPIQSIQFVQKICEQAKSFENRVNTYRENDDTVNYYVIQENLVQLLEQLDKIKCKNDKKLLQEVLTTTDYIKNLLSKLESKTRDNVKDTKIIELADQFNFKPETITAPRDSVEFVRIIHQQARSLEERANNYRGTDYSTDYYVIHENLVRLLEELDKVKAKGNDELLQELLRVMGYINKLLAILEANASDE